MKGKLLFVSNIGRSEMTGGGVVSIRNYESLISCFDDNNVDIVKLDLIEQDNKTNKIFKLWSRLIEIFSGFLYGLNNYKISVVLDLLSRKSYEIVYLDSSLLGKLAKRIRLEYPNIKIVTYYHNVEYVFMKEHIKATKQYSRLYWIPLAMYNEFLSKKYSDTKICINERDAKIIEKIYSFTPDAIIPVSIKDGYVESNLPVSQMLNLLKLRNSKIALFVGSYFASNYTGLQWFAKEVFDKLTDVQLLIVGRDMNLLKLESEDHNNIHIYSNIEDLSPFYRIADFMIMPIFTGSGMKVKTAEALMHGKYIFGTTEAFVGYNICNDIGCVCDTADDFVKAINSFNACDKFNERSRETYLKYYSFDSTLSIFKRNLLIENES